MSICKFMMGLNPDRIPNPNPSSSSSSLYGQEQLQLRLYQAFIFSIPILFSIILFLLFYVFYLKRRSINTINFHQTLPITTISTTATTTQPVMMRAKLQTILVDEDLIRTKDKLCSVCLGEFQMGEELHQLPSCRHVFHADCIRLWLYSSSTCPLCRTFIAHHHPDAAPPISSRPGEEEST